MSSISPDVCIICGKSSNDNRSDQHHAVSVARQLHAIGKWDGQRDIIVHRPHDLHCDLQFSGRPTPQGAINVYPGVHDLVEGEHYDILGGEAPTEKSVNEATQMQFMCIHRQLLTVSGNIAALFGELEDERLIKARDLVKQSRAIMNEVENELWREAEVKQEEP